MGDAKAFDREPKPKVDLDASGTILHNIRTVLSSYIQGNFIRSANDYFFDMLEMAINFQIMASGVLMARFDERNLRQIT